MPHHEHEVEVFDARTGAHLGAAFVAGRASAEQIAEVHQARAARRRQLQADLRAAEKDRRIRYAAATVPAPPRWVLPRALAQPLAGPGADVLASATPGRGPAAQPSTGHLARGLLGAGAAHRGLPRRPGRRRGRVARAIPRRPISAQDEYHIEAVGIFSARYARLTQWPLASLLRDLAGHDVGFPPAALVIPAPCTRSWAAG